MTDPVRPVPTRAPARFPLRDGPLPALGLVLEVICAVLAGALSGCTGGDAPGSPPSTGSTGIYGTGPGADPGGSTSVLPGDAALDDEERAFVALINDYRAQSHLPALQVSIALTKSSAWMSADMAAKNYFSHTDSLGRDPFTRMADFGYPTDGYSGENIAAGNAGAQGTFTQWKNSPAHNANMLGAQYAVIGVGRAYGASSDYGWYWTTDFGSTVDATVK